MRLLNWCELSKVIGVDRGGTHAPEYVQRIDLTPIQTTPDRKLALVMGRFTAEDACQIHQKFPVQPGISIRTD